MFSMIKTPAFVIKKFDFREYDRTYIVYTKELGKISLLARGARRIKSKLAPNLENFDEVKVNFIKGRIFNHLAGASTIARNNYILNNGNKISFAYDCLNLLDRFVKPEERDDSIYDLVREVLPIIDKENEINFPKIQIYFFWKLIDLLGYRPQLDSCALCGFTLNYFKGETPEQQVPPLRVRGGQEGLDSDKLDLFFNITDNIIICRKCAGQGILIKEDTLKKLREVFRLSLNEFLEFDLDNQLIGITNKAKQI
ncbi:DNA repair protein RecO, partial [Patescibacteria group bacterium]|nr:DNA repair protein RecO [Patescibacteria group bacterium]